MLHIRQIDCLNPADIAYCRNGYGEHVIPADGTEIMGQKIPTAFVAVTTDGIRVGRAVLGYETEPAFWIDQAGGKDAPWIYAVFVEEEYRLQNLGQGLIKACLDYLSTHGFKHVCLDTHTAAKWYQDKFGFKYSHNGLYEGQTMEIYHRPV